MLKPILFTIFFSLLAILLLHEISWVLFYLMSSYKFIMHFLAKFIIGNYLAYVLRSALALFCVSAIFAIIPSFIYWIFARKQLIYFPYILMVTWLLLLAKIT